MFDRRSFLKTAILGGAAFGAGLKLGDGLGLGGASGRRVVLHGFLPADEGLVQDALAAFLALDDGRLPAPALDAAPAWRLAAAGALRQGADRYVRDGRRMFTVQISPLGEKLPADLLLQQGGAVLDPRGGFGGRLLALRERVQGREAQVQVSCRLEDRPGRLGRGRVLVIETERGVQEQVALDERSRRLELSGPAGRTTVQIDERGARVTAASCRHATCRRQGAIARPGELIACAPNRLVLRVETA
jgi:hypothetical protein